MLGDGCGSLCGALTAVWAAFGRDILPPAALGGVGRYLADKARVYGRAGKDSARGWTRTERPGENNSPAREDGE